jgi:hypothetical protein
MDKAVTDPIAVRGHPSDKLARDPLPAIGADPLGGFCDVFTLVCAWCKAVIEPGGGVPADGICPVCRHRLEAEGLL